MGEIFIVIIGIILIIFMIFFITPNIKNEDSVFTHTREYSDNDKVTGEIDKNYNHQFLQEIFWNTK